MAKSGIFMSAISLAVFGLVARDNCIVFSGTSQLRK